MERREVDEEVIEVMRRQHGVLTRAQALARGMTSRQVEQRVRSGQWVLVARGVYRHAAVPMGWKGSMMASSLALGAVVSHRSAAALHRISGYGPGPRELVVVRGRGRMATRLQYGITVHETTQVDRIDLVELDGIPCTGLARTVLDLAAVVRPKRLGFTVDSVIRDRMLDWPDLYSVLVRHSRRGRDGCGRLRALLDLRYGDQVPMSDWSRMVADLLRRTGLPEPALEFTVVDEAGRFVARVDLAFPSIRLAIELDSIRHHMNHESFRKDPRRRNRLTVLGWTVLNFTWDDYVDDPDGLCDTVVAAHRKLLRLHHL
jgi:very-short-patch-repair endonuclease